MGTIKTTNIEPIADNGTVTLGSSGDTFTVPSGVTVNMSNATQTGVGGVNTPAFEASLSANQTVSNDTETKVQCNTEIYDTDNAYDNSTNYRFTPQTAGKYFVYATVNGYGGGNSNLNSCRAILKKNGTTVKYSINDFRNNPAKTNNIMVGATLDMNGSSDYVELYAHLEYSSSATIHLTGASDNYTNFGAYRIIT